MILKYLFDKFFSFTGLLFLWPVLIIVAVLIRKKMPGGPVIFKQKRVGRHGRLFTMYKFRSMTVAHSGSSVSVAGEARITPLGAKLRRYKIDELPELWNVLVGEMSFVGPRPDVPGYADQLEGDDRRVLLLRPGITGPASLKYRDEEEMIADFVDQCQSEAFRLKNNVPSGLSDEQTAIWYNDNVIYPDKVKLNLFYLDHYSFIKDCQIILCTLLGKNMMYNGEEL